MTSYVKLFFNFIRSFTIGLNDVNHQNAKNVILHQTQSKFGTFVDIGAGKILAKDREIA